MVDQQHPGQSGYNPGYGQGYNNGDKYTQGQPPPFHSPPFQPQPPTAPMGGPPEQNEGLATASLILGIIGILGALTSIPAIICGHIALGRIKRSGGLKGGRGMATAGLVMGYVMTGVAVIALLGGLALFRVGSMRSNANEEACRIELATLKTAAEALMVGEEVHPTSVEDLADYLGPETLRGTYEVDGENVTQISCS